MPFAVDFPNADNSISCKDPSYPDYLVDYRRHAYVLDGYDKVPEEDKHSFNKDVFSRVLQVAIHLKTIPDAEPRLHLEK